MMFWPRLKSIYHVRCAVSGVEWLQLNSAAHQLQCNFDFGERKEWLQLEICSLPTSGGSRISRRGSRGGVPGARPPKGSRFFRFDIQNFWNVTASGVHASRTRSTPRQWLQSEISSSRTPRSKTKNAEISVPPNFHAKLWFITSYFEKFYFITRKHSYRESSNKV